MFISKAEPLGARTLPSYLKHEEIIYGEKFQRFAQVVAKKFERMIRVGVSALRARKNHQNFVLPCVIFAVFMIRKAQRVWEDPEFNRKDFLEDIRYRTKDIIAKSNFPQEMADRFFECVMYVLNDVSRIPQLFEHHYKYIYELINMCCDKKVKEFQLVQHYSLQEMSKISVIFREKLYFINYDENKDALDNVPVEYKAMYLLKAKELYFYLVKLQDITAVRTGSVSHEELAEIFQISHKLESQVKQSKLLGTQEGGQANGKHPVSSPSKGPNYQTELKTNKSQEQSSIKSASSPLKSVIKSTLRSSSLFPQQVKCKFCCRVISQFNALYWNYATYCLQCVVSPKVDVSFIPTTVIKKFLKSMKYDNNSPYHVICPECKSEGVIKNYRVEDKAKEFKCRSCMKIICIEHQRLILECFCFCVHCSKQTITIDSLFQKYCPTCKSRLCELCNYKGSKECECLCRKCGEVSLVDHDCQGCCHACKGMGMTLMACPCGLKLCSMCFFRSFQQTEAICVKGK